MRKHQLSRKREEKREGGRVVHAQLEPTRLLTPNVIVYLKKKKKINGIAPQPIGKAGFHVVHTRKIPTDLEKCS